MSKARGWKCIVCGGRTETRNYVTLRMVTTGYVGDLGWKLRRICDDCKETAPGKEITARIEEVRTAQEPPEDHYWPEWD